MISGDFRITPIGGGRSIRMNCHGSFDGVRITKDLNADPDDAYDAADLVTAALGLQLCQDRLREIAAEETEE